MRKTLILDVPHRQVVFTIPKRLRVFFKYKRRLLGDLCRCALRALELFAREVLADLVRKELLSPEWAERILSWRHTGFSVHSRVRANTKPEAERVGKYMTGRCCRWRGSRFWSPKARSVTDMVKTRPSWRRWTSASPPRAGRR
jgi:hypothetical protein